MNPTSVPATGESFPAVIGVSCFCTIPVRPGDDVAFGVISEGGFTSRGIGDCCEPPGLVVLVTGRRPGGLEGPANQEIIGVIGG